LDEVLTTFGLQGMRQRFVANTLAATA